MRSNRFFRGTALLLTTGILASGLTACGSDSDDSGDASTAGSSSGTTGQVTPDSNAAASAGDKSPNAPDDGISNRPGGPGKPTSP